jgi:acyl-CoA synthetase (AMP-forming)/AMP-acid ligase II
MTVASGISCVPDTARVWSGTTPDKAALIDAERVVTYAQLNDRSNRIANTLAADVSDLLSHCRGLIAGYKVPKETHVMDALPQTASGKVQKAVLRQQLQGS